MSSDNDAWMVMMHAVSYQVVSEQVPGKDEGGG